MSPSRSILSIATLQDICLLRPSGLSHPNCSHTRRESAARFIGGSESIRSLIRSISWALKLRPQ
jgi:hypothetical protein